MITSRETTIFRHLLTRLRFSLLLLLSSILFFLIATRFSLILQPSKANARAAISDMLDARLVPHLQIDAMYGSALDGSRIVVFHADTRYG